MQGDPNLLKFLKILEDKPHLLIIFLEKQQGDLHLLINFKKNCRVHVILTY